MFFRNPLFALSVAIVLTNSTEGVAGRVELSSGGQLTGKVRRTTKDDGSTSHAVVKIDEGLSLAVAGTHVRRVIPDQDLKEYRQRASAVGDDAEANYQLARWCKSKSLLAQYHYHLRRTIALAPEHQLARAALGYVKNPRGRGWVSYAKLRRSQGLVPDKRGRWALPEVLAARHAASESDKNAKLWIRQFRRLHTAAARGDTEALQEIEAIDDPLATHAIASQLQRTRKSSNLRSLRLVYVRLLGRLRNSAAVKTLVELGVNEPDALIREEALRQLTEYGASSAVATYVGMLKSKSPAQVKAAAAALAFFPQPELAFSYVDALVTQRKTRRQIGSGGTDASFGNGGVSGLSQGGKIVEVSTPVRHPETLRLLKMIAPDVDYGYDESAWRRYFASQRNPLRSDLRRDP